MQSATSRPQPTADRLIMTSQALRVKGEGGGLHRTLRGGAWCIKQLASKGGASVAQPVASTRMHSAK